MNLGRHSYIAGEYHEGELPITVGNFTQIGENFFVHGHDNMISVFRPELVSNYRFTSWYEHWPVSAISKGAVSIGGDVWIGRDVKVLSGVHIGNGAIVAAHSVVTKDVPAYSLVAGNPATVKRMRFSDDTIAALQLMEWWNWDDKCIAERLPDMMDVDVFVAKYGKENV
jgi:virginiamycin A acetyltransferase